MSDSKDMSLARCVATGNLLGLAQFVAELKQPVEDLPESTKNQIIKSVLRYAREFKQEESTA